MNRARFCFLRKFFISIDFESELKIILKHYDTTIDPMDTIYNKISKQLIKKNKLY